MKKLILKLEKSKEYPIGHISQKTGLKKISKGKWVSISKKENKLRLDVISSKDIKKLKEDIELRNEFITQNQVFVRDVINRIMSKIKNVDDSVQNANIGFIKAIDKFNVKKSSKAFLSYVRSYMTGYIFKGIAKEMKGLDRDAYISSFSSKEEETSKGIEEIVEDPRQKKDIEEVEFKRNIELMKERIKSKEAKQILDYMLQGYNKASISRLTKTSKANITKLVNKHIKPIAKEFLAKSKIWQEFIQFLKEF